MDRFPENCAVALTTNRFAIDQAKQSARILVIVTTRSGRNDEYDVANVSQRKDAREDHDDGAVDEEVCGMDEFIPDLISRSRPNMAYEAAMRSTVKLANSALHGGRSAERAVCVAP